MGFASFAKRVAAGKAENGIYSAIRALGIALS
jgi:hypothetical protein